ncbi:MAG TPA: hypothetical protein VF285_12990 [Castellaniella sp.]|uniref:SWIM zinc finger family protein n=1 Tax=Castellaniella sp. TaxID=1955812 RepID=UPI002EF3DE86
MIRQAYGKTWWGAQWLNALTHLDYDNRLPRGRSYANKGVVKDLSVEGGTIHAKVMGSRRQPYRVVIQVPPLQKTQVNALVDRIATQPLQAHRGRDLPGMNITMHCLHGAPPRESRATRCSTAARDH